MGIRCVICGRFIAYKDFDDGKTTMVEGDKPAYGLDPPEDAPAHIACAKSLSLE